MTVQAVAVVADFDMNLATFMACLECDQPSACLMQTHAVLRQFDAVVNRVAKHVHQRIADRFYEFAIQFCVLSTDSQLDFLSHLATNITSSAEPSSETWPGSEPCAGKLTGRRARG